MDELWVNADGTPIFVRAWGKPRDLPVLCWHGVGLTNRASLFLNEPGPRLASYALRIFALDVPGFGRSPPLEPEAYRPQALADLVPPLLDGLGVRRASFLGHSWGADVGCHVAARHRGRLSALVLVDAGYADPPLDAAPRYEARVERLEREWQDAVAPSWDAVLDRLRKERRRTSPAIEAGWRAGWVEEEGRLVPSRAPRIVAAVEHGMASNLPSQTYPSLAAGSLPVLVVAAGDARQDELTRFSREVPQAEIRVIHGAGHDVLNDGGPDVVRAVGEWLVANGGAECG